MSAKGIAIFSVDTDVLSLFKLKFPAGTRSELIENFMRDVCQVAEQVVQVDSSKLRGMIEEARQKKHEASVALKELEIQLQETEKKAKRDAKEKEELLKEEFKKHEFEADALQQLAKELDR